MRFPRLVLAATVAGTFAVSGAAASGAPAKSSAKPVCLGQHKPAGQGWDQQTPPFQYGPKQVSEVVSTPFQPDRMYATNGHSVVLSEDAGCHWIGIVVPKGGSSLGQLPSPVSDLLPIPTTTTVTALAAPSSATVTTRVYVAVQDSSLLNKGVRVGYYDGSNWHWDSSGLPSSGRITELAASPTSPSIAYAVVDPTNQLSQGAGLYATTNGGATWTLENASARSSGLQHLRVDPAVPNLLYALGPNGLVVSRDGGRNFAASGPQSSDFKSYDVAASGGSVRIVQGASSSPFALYSRDAGTSWQPEPAPVSAKLVGLQPLLGQIAVSDGKALAVLDPRKLPGTTHCKASFKAHSGVCHVKATGYARLRTPTVGAPTADLQLTAPLSNGYAIVGLRNGSILRGTFSLAGNAIASVGGLPVRLVKQTLPKQFPSTLTPGKQVIALAPGKSRDVHYQLLMPRTPAPIDVMFLIDTTSSMEHTIDGLRRDLGQIVNDLSTAGLNVEFGLADFRDYAPTTRVPGDGDLGDYPYRLDVPVGPVSPALSVALRKLRADGGGDPPEADLTALYQSTTGAGQVYRRAVVVRSGQEAGYRPEALKLAVLATDSPMHHERDYLTPSWASTVATLIAHGVHPIGLSVQKVDDQNATPQGFPSLPNLQTMAHDTNTLAPRGGVDCNGDLSVDVAAGGPFVCKVPAHKTGGFGVGNLHFKSKIEPLHLAPAITTAAESLPDVRTVGLGVRGAPAAVARVVNPAALPRVNVKIDNTIGFTVRYSCPLSHKPHVYRLGIDAATAGRVLASSPSTLSCGAIPVIHPPKAVPVIAAAAVPAAAAPPPPAPPANPPPNPNPNPNPALNPNVGFASQEEEQQQLAFAGADQAVEDDTTTELAMSRLGAGAAVLMMVAAGYAGRRRLAAAWHQR
ncbi:MAG: hypothetical protein JO222_07190 [Frankiales bacterium]|nr:hypothetical protein [Frankiales bacterium]